MARKKIEKSKFADGDHITLGMFTDRPIAAAKTAVKELRTTLLRGVPLLTDNDDVEAQLARTIQRYYEGRDADGRLRIREAKKLIEPARQAFSGALTAMRELASKDTRAIRMICGPRDHRSLHSKRLEFDSGFTSGSVFSPHQDLWPSLEGLLLEAIKGCHDVLIEPDNAEEINAIKRLCIDLMRIRESVTNLDFKRSWDHADGAFVRPDARFVQIVIQAAEPELRLNSIMTSIKSACSDNPSPRWRSRRQRSNKDN